MSELPLVAVCIPGYNLGEQNLPLLDRCLRSIEVQDYPNVKVIVSDNSEDYEIADHIHESWKSLDIVYDRYEKGRGVYGVPNMNNTFDLAPEGSLIKPLNQDDFLKTPVAISRMVDVMQATGAKWAACGCDHVDDDGRDINYVHPPRWVPGFELAYGLNHIGGLSVVMVPQDEIRQDEELMFLNDCEYYYRLGLEYGPPALIGNSLVTVSMRKGGLSNTLDLNAVKQRDQRYVQKKHGVTE